MGFKSKFKTYFNLDDHVEEVERFVEEPDQTEERPPLKSQQKAADTKDQSQNVVSLKSVQKNAKMLLIEPRSYEETQDIADHLKNRKAVVINLQRIDREQALRVVDFLSGTVYAIGGDIQKLGPSIFLCTPDNVEITGSISDLANQF
ncbi:FtsZ-interacting protein related to cell division [Bacillus sp. JCM 19046]|uniref:Cell division protein SepF n=1 Tax=Shouchella xiaoxiensis TaxID=766895 RepID=A0ABS2SPX5_9BACI|nr:cell division protein SepF [Shouchella xiaoxiensis]MBM7837568.1 cell division inhibitor SepF [Shouchella xiaoxiensis]GAF15158.1 FtsZ-interacting protein related to cell division [Bacillus sp. JCM 19045]GAF16463.1 FtsZ-interacting protein related to cell division [Bacillus sp. JCM 19046]